ncbi:inner membrane protein OXA1-like [Euphorbia peplus]|nr:inner membrane protein OXA1-like [Euphorbia peplus]
MAYIRSLSTRANLLTRQCRSSISYHHHHHHHHHDDTEPHSIHKTSSASTSNFKRCFGTTTTTTGSFANSSSICFHFGASSSFCRHMSSTTTAEIISDSALQPPVNEVAVAAADSFFPVAFTQHFIDAIHSFTGLNWWASIVLTTLVTGGAGLPIAISNLKAISRKQLMKLRLFDVIKKVQNQELDRDDAAKLLKPLWRLGRMFLLIGSIKELFGPIPVFICFFLAISNMAEKVPSFKTGGAYWFLDLSTPDTLYIFPVLTALTLWTRMELSVQEKLGRTRVNNAGVKKVIYRCLAVLTVPFTMGLPTGFLCYLVTSNILSSAYKLALMRPTVKNYLGLLQMTERTVISPVNVRLPQMTQRTGTTQVNVGLPQMTQRTVTSQVNAGVPQVTQTRVLSQVKVKGKKKKKNKKNRSRHPHIASGHMARHLLKRCMTDVVNRDVN